MSTKNTPAKAAPAGALATPKALQGDWAFRGDATDILIPKLLVAQSTSKAVQDEKVSFGHLYKSTNHRALGGKDKPLEVIPLYFTKTWVLSQKVGGKFEFRAIEAFTPENRDEPWQFTRAGAEWKREQSLNFFLLLPTEIQRDLEARAMAAKGEIPDLEDSLLPCVLSFKSTSYKVGKILVTHFAKASDFNVPPFVSTFLINTVKTSNDQGTYFVLDVQKGAKADPAFFETCAKWRGIVSSKNVKVDESDVEGREEVVETMTSKADGTVEF